MESKSTFIQLSKNLFDAVDIELDEDLEAAINATGKMDPGWAQVPVNIMTSKMIVEALENHALALNRSAEASDRHAKSLTLATWILAVATIVLAITSVFILAQNLNLIK